MHKWIYRAEVLLNGHFTAISALFTSRSRANTWVKGFSKRIRTKNVDKDTSVVIDGDTGEQFGTVKRLFVMC